MSALSNLSKYIKGKGFPIVSKAYGISVFLKGVDARFSIGFVVSQFPKEPYPTVSFGVLDLAVSGLLRKIESTEHIKLCGLTFQSELDVAENFEGVAVDGLKLAIDDVLSGWFSDEFNIINELLAAYREVREPAFYRGGLTEPMDSLMPLFSLLAKLVDGESLSSEYVGEFYRRYLQLGFSSRILKYKIGELETYLNSL